MTPLLAPARPLSVLAPTALLRLIVPLFLLLIEITCATVAFDTQGLRGKGTIVSFIGDWAPVALRFGLAMSAGLLLFGAAVWRSQADRFLDLILSQSIRWWWLAVHVVAVSLLAFTGSKLFWSAAGEPLQWLVLLCLALAVLAMVSATLWTIPPRAIALASRTLRSGWAMAGLLAVAVSFGSSLAQAFWQRSAMLTFQVVEFLLQPFLAHVFSEPASRMIGSQSFKVQIAPGCSGLEGVAMVLAFSSCWLWYFRHEYRFPNALILVPAGAVAMWLLNCLRIAVLIMIGHAGAPDIAVGGFHSQAGWLAFIVVAMAICALSRRITFISAAPQVAPPDDRVESVAVGAYLMPFLAILAAGMISKTVSGTFEWLYPLRIIAAAAAIWFYRKEYSSIPWRCGPLSIAAGGIVFLIWVALDRSAAVPMSPELAAMAPLSRALWIGMRVAGAVIIVPVAEELAFRGFLLRRLASPDFAAVPWRSFSWMPFTVSSLAFGALHGDRWIEGTLAGMIYAAVMHRTGRLGDAVASHALTNVMLAALVVIGGQWKYW